MSWGQRGLSEEVAITLRPEEGFQRGAMHGKIQHQEEEAWLMDVTQKSE